VAEVKTNFHRVFGVSIRVSKETFLPLNVQPEFSFEHEYAEDYLPEVCDADEGEYDGRQDEVG
jgi:hypothetical protein